MKTYEPKLEVTLTRERERRPARVGAQFSMQVPLADVSRITCECGAQVSADHLLGETFRVYEFVSDGRTVHAVELDEPPCAHWAPVEVP